MAALGLAALSLAALVFFDLSPPAQAQTANQESPSLNPASPGRASRPEAPGASAEKTGPAELNPTGSNRLRESLALAGQGQGPVTWAENIKAKEVFDQAARDYHFQVEMGPSLEPAPDKEKWVFPKEIIMAIGAALLGLALFLVLRSYILAKKAAQKKIEKQSPKKEKAIDTEALQDTRRKADLLASQGLITEAMHTILLDTIEDLKNQKNLIFPNSFTSREIVNHLRLGLGASQSLGEIVTTVEPTWFGADQPGLEQYEILRQKYDNFINLLSQGAAA
ncbi:MAG: hypothetical protein LBE80_00350 [Deltaproteobacteria bacterium]|nr:hypothetical protein [Deltaproteobacteria bacterium]